MPLGKPEDCPKFEVCSAPVCPLDPACLHTQHVEGEPVCYFMVEFVKDGAGRRFLSLPDGDKWVKVLSWVVPEVKKFYPSIARKLENAEKTPGRMGKKVGAA